MSFLKTIRSRMRAADDDGTAPEGGLSDADQALTDRYARLNERDAVAELARLNQAELDAVDKFERTHDKRDSVLNKLRYLRQPEPLPDYDGLEPEAITVALADADMETIKAVREYEHKRQNRPGVNSEIAAAHHRLRASQPAPDPDAEPPMVVGNGLPIKVRPESGLGTP